MPGTPVYGKKTIRPAGWPVHLHTFRLILGDESLGYSVTYADYPDFVIRAAAPSKILEFAHSGAEKNADHRLLTEREISLNGCPGREFTVIRSNKLLGKTRCYLVKQRLYMVMAVTPKDQVSSRDATKFLDSFKLTKK